MLRFVRCRAYSADRSKSFGTIANEAGTPLILDSAEMVQRDAGIDDRLAYPVVLGYRAQVANTAVATLGHVAQI